MSGSVRNFADLDRAIGSVPAQVVTMLSAVDVGRGMEALYRDQLPGVLRELSDRARVASITTSSAIEGVVVDDPVQERKIVEGRAGSLRTRSEQELAGYRDALDYLVQEDWRPLNSGLLLHLHRLLFGHTAAAGGTYKGEDNLVVDRQSDGSTSVRFEPVPAARAPFYVEELVQRFRTAMDSQEHHPILLTGLFALDFSITHPFEDGNGRIARLITNALLADAGYGVVRYVSHEKMIERSADEYYDVLLASTRDWHADASDPWPWLTYFVRILRESYRTFSRRAAAEGPEGTKQERVREYVERHAAEIFRVSDIRAALPGVSDPTIRKVLAELRAVGVVEPEGTGRAAVWRKVPDAD